MELLLTTNIPAISALAPSSVGTRQDTGKTAANGPGSSRNNESASDKVSLSREGLSRQGQASQRGDESPDKAENNGTLTPEEEKQLLELKARDREVRIHEQAHLSAAGRYAAGGPSFTYQQGPDGNKYAIGGEVPIDVSKEATPEETILKMQIVRQAALSPAEPSSADRQIAAKASMLAAQARQELAMEQSEKVNSGDSASSTVENDAPITTTNNRADASYASINSTSGTENSGGVSVGAMIQAYSSIQALGE